MKRVPIKLTPRLALAYSRANVLLLSESAFDKVHAVSSDAPAAPARAATAPDGKAVALMQIEGPLLQRAQAGLCGGFVDGYDAITSRLCSALQDPSIGSIILVIDSPGGDSAGMFVAIDTMKAAIAAAGKPVFAYADEMAASAAYAIACLATAGIFAPRGAEVGSVGAICVHYDVTGMNEKDGISFQIFRSGSRKAEGLPIEPLNDTAAAALQSRVDGVAAQFFEHVSSARGVSTEQLAAIAGACLTADQAKAAGLIDAVASLDTVIALAGGVLPTSSQGDPMTAEEQSKMDDLIAQNATLKEQLKQSKKAADGEGKDSQEEEPSDPDDDDDDDTDSKAKASAEVLSLRAENTKLKTKLDASEAVDAAIREGKLTPGKRKKALKIASESPAAFASFLDLMPQSPVANETPAPAANVAAIVHLSADDLEVCRQLNITPAAFAAANKIAPSAQKGSNL